MKAEDLRINSLILIAEQWVGRVVSIYSNGVEADYEDKKKQPWHFHEIKGIPLSTDFLLEVGFKYDVETNSYWHEMLGSDIAIRFWPEVEEVAEHFMIYVLGLCEIGKPFYFLHELQNLIFCMTGRETVQEINPK